MKTFPIDPNVESAIKLIRTMRLKKMIKKERTNRIYTETKHLSTELFPNSNIDKGFWFANFITIKKYN